MLVVVADAAAEDDTCATRRQRQWVPRTDLSGAQRSTCLGEAHAKTTSASGTHSGDAAGDSHFQLPGSHTLANFTVELRSVAAAEMTGPAA
jgi:hypothetical protein